MEQINLPWTGSCNRQHMLQIQLTLTFVFREQIKAEGGRETQETVTQVTVLGTKTAVSLAYY